MPLVVARLLHLDSCSDCWLVASSSYRVLKSQDSLPTLTKQAHSPTDVQSFSVDSDSISAVGERARYRSLSHSCYLESIEFATSSTAPNFEPFLFHMPPSSIGVPFSLNLAFAEAWSK